MTEAARPETLTPEVDARASKVMVGEQRQIVEAVNAGFARSLERRLRESEAQVAALRTDAERWRFASEHGFPRRHDPVSTNGQVHWGYTVNGLHRLCRTPDAAIDLARAGEPK